MTLSNEDLLRAEKLCQARYESATDPEYRAEMRALASRLRSVAENCVLVPRELPVAVMVQVCGSDHPEDYQQVAEGWRDCLNALSAAQGDSRE